MTSAVEQVREDWKHVTPDEFLVEGASTPESEIARLLSDSGSPDAWARVVFVGGEFRPDLSSLPSPSPGTRLSLAASGSGLGSLDPENHPLLAMSRSEAGPGVLFEIEDGASAPGPVHILEIASGSSGLRHRVRLGEGASAVLAQTHLAPGGILAAERSVLEADLAADSRLEHARIHAGSTESVTWSALVARVGARASLRALHLGLGGGLARAELHADLVAPGADIQIDGLAASRGADRFDALTSVRHLARDCTSRQLWKSLARDRSVGSFTGCIHVAPGADGTSAIQNSRNILLSREAAIHGKPQLEIWADDVKCSHGSATGRLDEKAIFFLRSRGLSPLDARRLLVKAFADEIVGKIPWDSTRERMESRLAERI